MPGPTHPVHAEIHAIVSAHPQIAAITADIGQHVAAMASAGVARQVAAQVADDAVGHVMRSFGLSLVPHSVRRIGWRVLFDVLIRRRRDAGQAIAFFLAVARVFLGGYRLQLLRARQQRLAWDVGDLPPPTIARLTSSIRLVRGPDSQAVHLWPAGVSC